jgi:valyl-tRNA synthetase
VRDKKGRKMSKSLGNSPDPLELIEKFGADGVRVGILLCSPAGNDLPFDESLCEQGRNFANKLWNAYRLIAGWSSADTEPDEDAISNSAWFANKLKEQQEIIENHFAAYRISEALMVIYKLIWDDFCAEYLERIKFAGKDNVFPKKIHEETIGFLETLLKLIHPFMPFISEEIWEQTGERGIEDKLIIAPLPALTDYDSHYITHFEDYRKAYVRNCRNLHQQKNIPLKQKFILLYPNPFELGLQHSDMELSGSVYTGELSRNNGVENKLSFVIKNSEFVFTLPDGLNPDKGADKDKMLADLKYYSEFLRSIDVKLSNQKFVANAKPEVIQNERNKKADAEAKISVLEKQLGNNG